MQGAERNSRHSDRNISLFRFLVGLRTYQHTCNILSTCKAPKEIHAILTETSACSLPGRAKDLTAPLQYTEPMQGAEGNSRHSDRNISLLRFLVGLRTYQHPCNILCTCKAPKEIHAILTETLACFLPGRAKDLSAPL